MNSYTTARHQQASVTGTSKFRLRACSRCGGDAYFDAVDEREWRCLQCARPVSAQSAAVRSRSVLVHDRRPIKVPASGKLITRSAGRVNYRIHV